jgi:hypothetical protein
MITDAKGSKNSHQMVRQRFGLTLLTTRAGRPMR